jgi:hypothetical protein
MKRQDPWEMPEKKSYVIVDGDYIPVDEVTFLDIEDDISGRDIMTFEWAGTIMSSFVVVK